MAATKTRAQLAGEIVSLESRIECLKTEISALQVHLSSDKFRGTETTFLLCPFCRQQFAQTERKDWIATADVWEWLRRLSQWLD